MHLGSTFALLAALTPPLLAATSTTYTGPDNGLWSDPSNWSDLTIPAYGTDVAISSPSPTTTRLFTSADCNNLTLSSNNILDASSSGPLNIFGTLTNNGLLKLGPGSYSSTYFVGAGSGSITLANAGCRIARASSNTISGSGGIAFGLLTNTGSVTAGPSDILGIQGDNFTNAASILANSGTITMISSQSPIYNTGTLTAAGTGVIDFHWSTDLSGGTIIARDNASIFLRKTVSNAVISASDNATISFRDVDNCTLSASSSTSFIFPMPTSPPMPTLHNVTFQGPVSIDGAALSGTLTPTSTLSLNHWSLAGDAILTGPGSTNLIGTSISSSSGRLTNLAADTSITGYMQNDDLLFTNAGTLSIPQLATFQISTAADAFLNTGTLRLAPSASADFRSPLTNTNGLIDLLANATATFGAPIIKGGTLRLAANAIIRLNTYSSFSTGPFACTLSSLLLPGTTNNWNATVDIDTDALALTPAPQNKGALLATLSNQIRTSLASHTLGHGISSSLVANDATGLLTLAVFDNADLRLPSLLGTPLSPDALIVAATIIGDANLDRLVDFADFQSWFTHVGGPAGLISRADFNLDNNIDLADFDLWYEHFGASFSPLTPQSSPLSTSSVPEPATLPLLLLPLLLRRRTSISHKNS